MQANDFDRHVLKIAVGQICHSLGWNSMQQSSLNVLTDILERYIKKVTKVTARYCQNFAHIDPDLVDLGLAFDQLGIQVCELDDYVHQVDPIHIGKTVCKYPLPCKPYMKFPTLEETLAREEYYGEHLPPLDIITKKETAKEQNEVNETIENKEELVPTEISLKILPLEEIKKNDVESPPYSPVEPKRLNLGAQLLMPDLTRPDLKVVTPKDFQNETLSAHPPTLADTVLSSPHQESHQKKTAEKRPAASLESFGSRCDNDKAISTPIPYKRSKLSAATSEIDNSFCGADDEKRTDKNVANVDVKMSVNNTLEHTQLDKRLNERHKPFSFSPDPLTSPLKDNKTFTSSNTSQLQKEEHENANEPNKLVLSSVRNLNTAKETKLLTSGKKTNKDKKLKSKKLVPGKSNKKRSQLGSPQLFASPHVLKSPPEPHVPAAPAPCSVSVTRLEVKPQNKVATPLVPKANSGKVTNKKSKNPPQGKTVTGMPADLISKTPTTQQKKEKKTKKKHVDKKSLSSQNLENERKSKTPYAVTEKKSKLSSPPWKHSFTDGDSKSPQSSKSPHFSVSQKDAISPNAAVPGMKIVSSSEAFKQDLLGIAKEKKQEEKKIKKEKKSKKKEKLESGIDIKEDKKPSTPSLKLTFKRSSTTNQQESTMSPASSTLKYHDLPPTLPAPLDAPPQKIVSPPLQPKKKKAKKDKSPILASTSLVKEKKTYEFGVKIEPLVVNEPSKDFNSKELKASGKKSESKKGHASKKGQSSQMDASPKKSESLKKSDSSKKGESSKKNSSKKTDSSKKIPFSKKIESSQQKPPLPLPSAFTPTEEQSVSRGLFIQTITEAPTTQVWYCPSCLRPDDGSPMIGCDSCDGWYHWTCVGIKEDPVGNADWYCSSCVEKMTKKKGKRRKKKE